MFILNCFNFMDDLCSYFHVILLLCIHDHIMPDHIRSYLFFDILNDSVVVLALDNDKELVATFAHNNPSNNKSHNVINIFEFMMHIMCILFIFLLLLNTIMMIFLFYHFCIIASVSIVIICKTK